MVTDYTVICYFFYILYIL